MRSLTLLNVTYERKQTPTEDAYVETFLFGSPYSKKEILQYIREVDQKWNVERKEAELDSDFFKYFTTNNMFTPIVKGEQINIIDLIYWKVRH